MKLPQPIDTDTTAVLRARARLLAREAQPVQIDARTLEVLEFRLANERYAVETACTQGVHSLQGLTPVPCTPPFIAGVLNVRGRIVTVLDLKKLFQLPDQNSEDTRQVVLLHTQETELAILAASVAGIRTISLNELQPPLPTLTGLGEAFLKGVTADRVAVIDAAKMMTDPRILVDEQPTGE